MIPRLDPETTRPPPPEWYRNRLLSQLDRCLTTADRSYLLETVRSAPLFSVALDELIAAGWVEIKVRRRSKRDRTGFSTGEQWLSEPALYRKPGTRERWLKEAA